VTREGGGIGVASEAAPSEKEAMSDVRMRSFHRALGRRLLPLCLFCFGAWPAQAQEARVQAAEALFQQAKGLMEHGDLQEACDKFAASQALEPGLGTLLYLGNCYERAGRFASALATFRAATELADTRGDVARRHLSSVRASALEPRVPTLEIRTGSAAQPPDLQITINGTPINRSDLDRPLLRDQGRHEIRFSAPGHEPFVARLELKNGTGQRAVVTIPRLVRVGSTRGGDPVEPRSSSGAAHPGDSQRMIAWVAGGTGLALAATSAVLAVLAGGKNLDSKQDCDPARPNRCGPEGVRLRKDAKSLARLGTLTGVAGGVGIASGLVLYVGAPASDAGVSEAALLVIQGALF
jgi:tetratricopeptide (TPR) repeat protein